MSAGIKFVHGSLPVGSMTGTRLKKDRNYSELYRLACAGHDKDRIAREIGLSKTTLYAWLARDQKAALVWEAGTRSAGTFTERQRPGYTSAPTDDEGIILLRPIDEQVIVPALKRRSLFGERLPEGKRVKHLRAITLLDTSIIIASLERLEEHRLVDRVEVFRGFLFTEYYARTVEDLFAEMGSIG